MLLRFSQGLKLMFMFVFILMIILSSISTIMCMFVIVRVLTFPIV